MRKKIEVYVNELNDENVISNQDIHRVDDNLLKISQYLIDLNSRIEKINTEADKFLGRGEEVLAKSLNNPNAPPDHLINCLSKQKNSQSESFILGMKDMIKLAKDEEEKKNIQDYLVNKAKIMNDYVKRNLIIHDDDDSEDNDEEIMP